MYFLMEMLTCVLLALIITAVLAALWAFGYLLKVATMGLWRAGAAGLAHFKRAKQDDRKGRNSADYMDPLAAPTEP